MAAIDPGEAGAIKDHGDAPASIQGLGARYGVGDGSANNYP
jgi:hypothetical protein